MVRYRLFRIVEKYLCLLDTGSNLYLMAFLINMLGETLSTTMFPVPGKFLLLTRLLAIVLVSIKLLWFDYLQKKELLCYGGLLGITFMIWVSSGYADAFVWAILLLGAKNVSFRKILQIYMIINLTVVFLAFTASLLGVIENLQYVRNGGIRNSFGIIYTTDFAAHILYMMLVYFYLKRGKMNKWDYIGAGIVAALVYYFCDTRLDVTCMFILIIGYVWVENQKKKELLSLKGKYSSKKWWEKYGIFAMPAAVGIMILLTVLYGKMNILNQLNAFISNRLLYGQQGLRQYGIRLFGQYVYMIGNGNTTKYQPDYFFVDCSYLYVLLRYGIIFLIILLGVYIACCKKYRKDIYFVLTVAVISLNCMIAHHIIEPAYNPFAWALFAAMEHRVPARNG